MRGADRLPRRTLLLATLAGAVALPRRGARAAEEAVRIGVTPVFLDDRAAFLARWRGYLAERLGRAVRFVQRKTYREITTLALNGDLEAAWICGFPYVRNAAQLRLLAVPVYQGQPLYRSYVIVAAADAGTGGIEDLAGRVFAYSDPDSNSGYLVPRVLLTRAGIDPERFFSRTFFTWSHRDVIAAVAERVADAGAVDGYVWDTLALHHPELTGATRVVQRSEPFGFPPIVARAGLPQALHRELAAVLRDMRDDGAGRLLLAELNLDGFVAGDPALFDGIRAAAALMER